MATSGSKTVNIFSWISMKFSWEQKSQDITGNTTTVGWKLELFTTTGALYRNNRPWSVTIDGKTYSGTVNVDLDQNDSQVCASGTATISHNGDGTKTFTYSFTHDFSLTLNSGKYMGAYSGSGSDALTTIPRKSTLTVATGKLGVAQILEVKQESDSFTHTIKAVCGKSTLYIKADGSMSATAVKHNDCNIPWTPPVEWAEQAPSDNSVSVTFTIETFSGNTSVGTMSPTPITCIIPNNNTFVPVLMPTITDAMGYSSTYGGCVQGQSKLQVDIETYGAYGAWITSVKTEFEGSVYSGTSVTTNIIKSYGSLPVTITVTDSRGRVSTSSTLISVLAYEMPKISSLTATRCNADGTANPSGEYLIAKFSASIYSLNSKNKASYYIGYKKVSETNHTAVHLDELSNKYSVSSSYIVPAETASSYTIIFTAIDSFGQARTTTTGASEAQVFSLLKKNGKIVGAAVGKIAEHEGYFDVGWKLKASGGGDVVVEQGEKDGWTYRKWDSGVGECWKILTHSTTVATQWGNLYVGNATERQNYPFAFTSKPVETVSITSGSEMGFLYPERNGNGVNGGYASARYNVCALSAITTAVTYYFNFHVTGKWK